MFKKEFILTIILMSFLLFACTANAAIPNDTLVIGANTEIYITQDPAVSFEVLPNVKVGSLPLMAKPGHLIYAKDWSLPMETR